jgi:hypothetical protein
LGNHLFPEEELFVGVHQLALPNGCGSLHPDYARRRLVGPEYGCATGNGARGYDHMFVMNEVKLVNQGPYPGRAEPAPWGNNTASYLDNQAQSYTFPGLPSADSSSSSQTLNYAGESIRYDTLAQVFKSHCSSPAVLS